MEFDWDKNIETVWNADIVEHSGVHYVLSNTTYNQNIEPKQTIEIFFQNSNSGEIETQPGNVILSEYGLVRRTLIDTLLNVRDISIDFVPFEYSDQGHYIVKDVVDSLNGKIRPGLLAASGNYSIENAWGKVLYNGEFTPNSQ